MAVWLEYWSNAKHSFYTHWAIFYVYLQTQKTCHVMIPKAPNYFVLLSLSTLCLSYFSCKEDDKKTDVVPIEISFKKEGVLFLKKAETDSIIKTIDIEIADDDYQKQTGLMYRNSMETHQGMLFVFDKEEYKSFYMKNTKIPLDIIYINSNKKIVNIQKNTKPFDETSLPSEAPVKYVLEINAGLSDQWNLQAGDKIDYFAN